MTAHVTGIQAVVYPAPVGPFGIRIPAPGHRATCTACPWTGRVYYGPARVHPRRGPDSTYTTAAWVEALAHQDAHDTLTRVGAAQTTLHPLTPARPS